MFTNTTQFIREHGSPPAPPILTPFFALAGVNQLPGSPEVSRSSLSAEVWFNGRDGEGTWTWATPGGRARGGVCIRGPAPTMRVTAQHRRCNDGKSAVTSKPVACISPRRLYVHLACTIVGLHNTPGYVHHITPNTPDARRFPGTTAELCNSTARATGELAAAQLARANIV